MDETSVNLGPPREIGKVIADADTSIKAQVVVNGNPIPSTTFLVCISASGASIPTTFLSRVKTLKTETAALVNDFGLRVLYSKSGWNTQKVFLEWVRKVFIPEAVKSYSGQDRKSVV